MLGGTIGGGAGAVLLDGTFTTSGNPFVAFDGGVLFGSDAVLSGTGTLTSSGAVAIADGGVAAQLDMTAGATWSNAGTVADAGLTYFGNTSNDTATIDNLAGAVFDLTSNDASLSVLHVGTYALNNAGTLAKTGGISTSPIGIPVSNTGTVQVTGGTLSLSGGVAQDVAGTLTAGTWSVLSSGGVAVLSVAGTSISTLAGSITLSGVNAAFNAVNSGTHQIESSLTGIASSGTLSILGGRNYAASSTLAINGGLILGGGTLSGPSLSTGSSGALGGYGIVANAVANAGHLTAIGGDLDLKSGAVGGGSALIDIGATLELGGLLGETVAFQPGGVSTMALDAPGDFTGTLSGVADGDIIDFIKTVVASATLSGSTLQVTIGAIVHDYQLAAALPGSKAVVEPDAAGTGSDVVISPLVYALALAQVNTASPIDFGNLHVGATPQTAIGVTNAATPLAEGLDATIAATGAATASGSFDLLAVGQTDTAGLTVGLAAVGAGIQNGSAVLGFVSDGTGTSGNPPTILPNQTVAVTGTAYRLASASVATPSNTILHVGDGGGTATAMLSVANTDPADGYSENLIATATGAIAGDLLSASGSSGDVAPASQQDAGLGGGIEVGVSTATAGTVSGTATVALDSDGTGIDGLGVTALGTTEVPVNITVDNYATAAIQQTSGTGSTLTQAGSLFTLDFGTVRSGSPALTVGLDIRNTASGPADLLSGVFAGAASGVFSEVGLTSFSGLSAGAAGDSSSITFNPNEGGTFTETLTLVPSSYNASGFSEVLPTETLVVSGTVELTAVANAVINTPLPIDFGSVHLNTAPPAQALSISNTAIAPAEDLDAQIAAIDAGLTASGSISLLPVGQTNSTSIDIGINTTTPGARDGNVTLAFQSDGQGTSGFGITMLPNQTVAVTGGVYALASPAFGNTAPVLHVGDFGTLGLIVRNVSGYGNFSEALIAAEVAATGGIVSASGTTGLIADGGQDGTALTYSVPTGTAGVVGGDLQLDLTSDGTGTSGLGQSPLPTVFVPISATIDKYATEVLSASSGQFQGSGTNATLDLGSVVQDGSSLSTKLALENGAFGPADFLSGALVFESGTGFQELWRRECFASHRGAEPDRRVDYAADGQSGNFQRYVPDYRNRFKQRRLQRGATAADVDCDGHG